MKLPQVRLFPVLVAFALILPMRSLAQQVFVYSWGLATPNADRNLWNWNAGTKTATLLGDLPVGTSIRVLESGLTLDGGGHTLSGTDYQHGIGISVSLVGDAKGIQNVTVKNFVIKDLYKGIQFSGCLNSSITQNTFTNTWQAIALFNSDGNTIQENSGSGNSSREIFLHISSGNLIANNTLTTPKSQIYLQEASSNNIIRGNTLSGGGVPGSIGIEIGYASIPNKTPCINNSFYDNNIVGNAYGVYIWQPNTGNEFYHNNFDGNGNPLATYPAGNVFYLDPPIGGNYYSNHSNVDVNKNDFADSPYRNDNYPWVEKSGWLDRTPTANAGPDRTIGPGGTIQLDGNASSDPEGQPLTYSWSVAAKPAGSTAELTNATSVNPTFHPDKGGQYTIRLTVSDGRHTSAPAEVRITVTNTRPTAIITYQQQTEDIVSVPIQLDGAGSSDLDGQALTYKWTFVSKPAGSAAQFSDASIVSPSFVPDLPGDYTVQLVVNDGFDDSVPAYVTISIHSRAQAVETLTETTQTLIADAGLSSGEATSLLSKLDGALGKLNEVAQLGSSAPGNTSSNLYTTAQNKLDAFVNQLDALVNSGRISEASADALRTQVQAIINTFPGSSDNPGNGPKPKGTDASFQAEGPAGEIESHDFGLMQNAPNPFNPSTTIEYTVPELSSVSLKVYDLSGHEVANLVDREQQPGRYQFRFDGSHLPSGVYIYRLQAGKLTISKKLVLVK